MRLSVVRLSLCVGALSVLAACSGGGNGGGSPTPVSTNTPTPTQTGAPPVTSPSPVSTTTAYSEAAFQCPTADSTTSVARTSTTERTRRMPAAGRLDAAPLGDSLEVTYATSSTTRTALAARETTLGVQASREVAFANIGRTVRTVQVGSANAATLISQLRSQPGVVSVTLGGSRRFPQAVTTPYYGNDPYFNGFTMTQNATANNPAPSTYRVPPYSETATVPGQWNMHAIGLEYAFGYSQANNGSGIVNANALGSSAIKIAVIDTGVDTALPDLTGKVTYQRCFITDPKVVQSTSTFVTDPDGHGTDVSGLAASTTANGLGFAAAGGAATIAAYRVGPAPDANCPASTTDPQCSENVADVVSAINDAVAQHVNVINLSLGGGSCVNGVDNDAMEANAIANAIAANIVVVAASGNDGQQNVTAPACDNGVIAAGATGLADGVTTGAGTARGSAASPIEYVASYSNYGAVNGFRNASAWGLVAPGGDPTTAEASSSATVDDLHWIEDLWTSTPAVTADSGNCSPDYPGNGAQTADCRTLIAGTSMASPTIAGAAALILAVNPSYQSPSKMRALLCATTDDLGDAKQGCGRLNVNRAIATALNDPKLP